MRTFVYLRWVRDSTRVVGYVPRRVEAATVEFGPAHVIFRDLGSRIVLAERVDQVNELREETADG